MSKNEMIMLPREVVEQAVEALFCTDSEEGSIAYKNELKAVKKLRAALDQPQNHVTDAGNMVPAVWKTVPVVPTTRMVDAARSQSSFPAGVWRAMLDAAPQPPALGRPQSSPTTPYLWYDPENGDTWTQEAINDGCCQPDGLIALYTK